MLLNKLTTVIRWFSLQIEKFSESEEVLRAFDDGSKEEKLKELLSALSEAQAPWAPGTDP